MEKLLIEPHFARDAVIDLKHKGKKINKDDKLPYTSVIDLVLGDGKLNYGDKPKVESDNNVDVAK